MPVIYTLKNATYPKYGYNMSSVEQHYYRGNIIVFADERSARFAARARRKSILDFHRAYHATLVDRIDSIIENILVPPDKEKYECDDIDNCPYCLKATDNRG